MRKRRAKKGSRFAASTQQKKRKHKTTEEIVSFSLTQFGSQCYARLWVHSMAQRVQIIFKKVAKKMCSLGLIKR